MPGTNLTATETGRRVVFAALYFSEGAPIGFIWWFLPTWLRDAGMELERFGAVIAVVTLAWVLKFLWAPLVDVLRGRRWGYRAWVLSAQLCMGLTLLPLMFLDLAADFDVVAVLLVLHALSAATQDVAIDGWAISVTPAAEYGRISGWMQAGYYGGRWLFGAGALMAATVLGPPVMMPLLVLVIWASSVLVFVATEAPGPSAHGTREIGARLRGFAGGLADVMRRRSTWLGLIVAFLAGAGFEAVGIVAGPYLVDLGFSPFQTGLFYTGNVVAVLVGALVGGWLSDRWGKARAVAVFTVLLALLITGLAGADAVLPTNVQSGPILAMLLSIYFGIGLFTAASYGLFMSLTDPRLGGTQFSTFMAGTNACESASAAVVTRLIPALGYPISFLIMAGVSLLALPVVLMIRTPQDRAGGRGFDVVPAERAPARA